MLVTKHHDSQGNKYFRSWLPFTTRTKDVTGDQWPNIWPRPNVIGEHNYTKSEQGQTATIPDWYVFPNWRRGAHSFNYIPITYEQDVNAVSGTSIIRDRKVSIGTWSSSNNRPNLTGRNWIHSCSYVDLGVDTQHDTGALRHCLYRFYPMAPGYLDDNNKCSYVGGFLDTPWTNQTYTKFFNLHNDYWFKYGDYTAGSQRIAENQILLNPTKYAHNDTYIDRDRWMVRMDRACLYNSYEYQTKVPFGTCEYFYCPEFYIVWSTDQQVNPSCFRAGVEGLRTNDSNTNFWHTLYDPDDSTSFHLSIGFRDSSCTTGSNVWFNAYTQHSGGTPISRKFSNDGCGGKIINLGQWGDKYFYAAYITAMSAASRDPFNPHLLGGLDSNFNRVTYKYWYYTAPFVEAEFGQPGSSQGMYNPMICPLGTTIRIHSFGMNFWGGEPYDLDRTWGAGANHYRGWITKQFNTSTILWPQG